MLNALIPSVVTLVAALLLICLTRYERSASVAVLAGDAREREVSQPDVVPRPRDRCECGHTFDWHHSCARDVCGCEAFVFARHEAA